MSLKQYLEQFPFEDPKVAEDFLDFLDEYIEKKIKNLSYDRSIVARVVSVGTGLASIRLLDGTEIIPNVKVRDGLSLLAGNFVYVKAINGSLNNLFIDMKK